MSQLMQELANFLTAFISTYGYFAVFLLMVAGSCLIPFPSEVTMAFAGFLSGVGILNIWLAIIIGSIGSVIGSLIAYWLGLKMGEEWIRKAIKKWGKFLLIRESEFDKSLVWFHKYGQGITFVSRLLPVVRTFISLPAGIAKMDIKLFTIFTFIGSFLWSALLAFMGLKLGQNWAAIEPFFKKFQYIIIVGFLALVALYVWKHLKKEDKTN